VGRVRGGLRCTETGDGSKNVIGFCRQSLANYKIPRCVEFSESELPKNGSGKILKRILRERNWLIKNEP